MFGYSRDEGVGAPVAALMPERFRSGHMKILERIMSLEGFIPLQQRTQEGMGLRKNGEEFFAEVTGAPWKSGDEVFYTVIYRDITERKKEQEQLRQAQKMEAIGTLAGGIAHDFNNILSSIYGYTEIALDDARDNQRISNSLAHVMKAAERARELVLQILTFSRKKEEEKKPLRIAPVIIEAVKLLRAAIPATIEIRANIDKNTGTILGDPTQIHQVIMNLCTNANHAMQEKGGVLAIELKPVSLTTGDVSAVPGLRLGPFIKLTVSDTGSGIDPAIIDRIFDPFFTTKELGRGTGMGLSVVHGIVKSHEGAITVASKPGRGSTFTVLLPRIDEKQQEQPVREKKPLNGGNESVLFVDDEVSLVEIGKQMLESLGYTVTAMHNSIEALEVFRKKPELFDVVITDHTMPYLTGYDLAEKILQIRKDIPVILCTGYSETVTEEKARSLGIRSFIFKPIKTKDLAVMIRKVLDTQEA